MSSCCLLRTARRTRLNEAWVTLISRVTKRSPESVEPDGQRPEHDPQNQRVGEARDERSDGREERAARDREQVPRRPPGEPEAGPPIGRSVEKDVPYHAECVHLHDDRPFLGTEKCSGHSHRGTGDRADVDRQLAALEVEVALLDSSRDLPGGLENSHPAERDQQGSQFRCAVDVGPPPAYGDGHDGQRDRGGHAHPEAGVEMFVVELLALHERDDDALPDDEVDEGHVDGGEGHHAEAVGAQYRGQGDRHQHLAQLVAGSGQQGPARSGPGPAFSHASAHATNSSRAVTAPGPSAGPLAAPLYRLPIGSSMLD